MKEYIEVDSLWRCETCFHRSTGKCSPDVWCDRGEGYRPDYSKFKTVNEKEIAGKIINLLEYNLEYAEYDKLQRGDKNVDVFCDGFKDAIMCIKEYYQME